MRSCWLVDRSVWPLLLTADYRYHVVVSAARPTYDLLTAVNLRKPNYLIGGGGTGPSFGGITTGVSSVGRSSGALAIGRGKGSALIL